MTYERLNAQVLMNSLRTVSLGKQVSHYDRVSSTNAIARKIAHAGCPEGAVVIAESQTRGKGRLGRSWDSPAGKNLYFSIVLRPRMTPAEAARLTLLAAVAVADTIHPLLDFAPSIKWPNDILLRGRKASGILCELATERERVISVVVGIGVNLNYELNDMAPAIRDIATSVMAESGHEVDRAAFAQKLIENLETHYLGIQKCGFDGVARSWNRYAQIRGQRMRAQINGENVIGTARGLDENGFLVLESASGTTMTVVAGDVSCLGPPISGAGDVDEERSKQRADGVRPSRPAND